MKYIKRYWKLAFYLFAIIAIFLGVFDVIPDVEASLYWCMSMILILLPRICDDVVDAMKGENDD